jgi:hypothetical protein
MPPADQALTLVVLLPICCLGPGLLIVSRLRFSSIEKLCSAFAASFILIYLASFGLFCLNAGAWAYWSASAVFAAMGIAGWRTGRIILRNPQARQAIWAFIFLLGWDFLHLAMVRRYGGGGWGGDWKEQYQRTQVFLGQLPLNFRLTGLFSLPARPPLMNLAAAFFARQVGLSFEGFSLTYLFFNAWAFLPCCLLLTLIAPPRRQYIPVLAVLFMLNPSVVENVTLTVTKQFAAGFVVLGVCFYLRGRVIPAAAAFAAGVLAHYSAVPYAAAVALHYLYSVLRRRRPLLQALAAFASAVGLLATWFVWSFLHFGALGTISSGVMTTGVSDSARTALRRTLYDLLTSIVPHPLHGLARNTWDSLQNLGQLNDFYFTMTQQTIPMMMGSVGGVVVLILLARRLFSAREPSREDNRCFWIFFIGFSFIVGIAVTADWSPAGVAQITLQSISLMGITLLSSYLPTSRAITFWLVLVGAMIDFSLGIFLHFDRQSYIYPTISSAQGTTILPDYALGRYGVGDYMAKLGGRYVFWGDHFAGAAGALELASIILAAGAFIFLIRFRARISKAAGEEPQAEALAV